MSPSGLPIFLLALLLLCACTKDDDPVSFIQCDALLAESCANPEEGDFCTFGFKWGADNPFSPAGLQIDGPQTAGGVITYRFERAGISFDTHSELDRITFSIDDFPKCYRDSVVQAFDRWEAVCAVSFEEVATTESADIVVMVADIQQSGLGHPPFFDGICVDLAGKVIFQNTVFDCSTFSRLALHEIGHALGLGHVDSENIMNPDLRPYYQPQAGDVLGVRSIYGP